MSAIKRAMGISHSRYVYLSDIRKFLRQNPTFKESDVYPKRSVALPKVTPQGEEKTEG